MQANLVKQKKTVKSHQVHKPEHPSKKESEIGKKTVKSHKSHKEVEKKKQADYNLSLDIAYQYLDQQNKTDQNSNEEQTESCSHENTINKDDMIVCIDCGEKIDDVYVCCDEPEWRYYGSNDNVEESDPSRCQYRKVAEKGITKDLLAIGFSMDVSDKANKLYLIVTKGDIKRSNYRKGIMFACVFYAFISLGKPQTTEYIRKIFKISKRIVSKGFTYYGLEMPKEKRDDYVYITAEHYIPKILKELNASEEHIKNVLEIYDQAKNKSYLLNTSNPQSIASGFVYYYLKKINSKLNGKLNADITPGNFGKNTSVNLSEVTITRISNEIEDILTSDEL